MIKFFPGGRLRVTSGGRYVLDKCSTDSEHMAAPVQLGEERRSCQLGMDELLACLVGQELHATTMCNCGTSKPDENHQQRILITTRPADRIEDLELAEKLCAVLMDYAGETSPLTGKSTSEKAVDVLKRIIAERAELLDIVAEHRRKLDSVEYRPPPPPMCGCGFAHHPHERCGPF